jgi:hypothetical protein
MNITITTITYFRKNGEILMSYLCPGCSVVATANAVFAFDDAKCPACLKLLDATSAVAEIQYHPPG